MSVTFTCSSISRLPSLWTTQPLILSPASTQLQLVQYRYFQYTCTYHTFKYTSPHYQSQLWTQTTCATYFFKLQTPCTHKKRLFALVTHKQGACTQKVLLHSTLCADEPLPFHTLLGRLPCPSFHSDWHLWLSAWRTLLLCPFESRRTPQHCDSGIKTDKQSCLNETPWKVIKCLQ